MPTLLVNPFPTGRVRARFSLQPSVSWDYFLQHYFHLFSPSLPTVGLWGSDVQDMGVSLDHQAIVVRLQLNVFITIAVIDCFVDAVTFKPSGHFAFGSNFKGNLMWRPSVGDFSLQWH